MTDVERKAKEDKVKDLKTRRGILRVKVEYLFEDAVRLAVSKMYITRAEYMDFGNEIHYWGYSAEFDSIDIASKVPYYTALCSYKEGNVDKVELIRDDKLDELGN